jgi:hypothetical protein
MAYTIDTDNQLFTLAELKSFLNYPDTSKDDELSRVVDAVSWFVNSFTGRKLLARDLTEYYDGDGTNKLYVDNYPINSSSSEIEVYVSTDVPRDYSAGNKVDADNILIYDDEGLIVVLNTFFSAGAQTVKVVYNGGYSTVPHDLKDACLQVASMLWKREKGSLHGLTTVSFQNGSATYEIEKAMPASARLILEDYRRYV